MSLQSEHRSQDTAVGKLARNPFSRRICCDVDTDQVSARRRILRRKTINWCRSTAFSASSQLFDLNGKAKTASHQVLSPTTRRYDRQEARIDAGFAVSGLSPFTRFEGFRSD